MSKKLNQQFSCSKMFLPEHRASLQQRSEKLQQDEDRRRPILDEQRQEELQQILEQAILNKQPLKLIVLNGSGYESCYGVPLRCDTATGIITVDSGNARPDRLKAATIYHIEPYSPGQR